MTEESQLRTLSDDVHFANLSCSTLLRFVSHYRKKPLSSEPQSTFRDLKSIDWASFQTAYGPATEIPGMLERLAGTNHDDAMAASHELWCALCHQHAYVSSAALPSLPILLHVLETANDELIVEILDILLGFAVCTTDGYAHPTWIDDLHLSVANEKATFDALSSSTNEDVAGFSMLILEAIEMRRCSTVPDSVEFPHR